MNMLVKILLINFEVLETLANKEKCNRTDFYVGINIDETTGDEEAICHRIPTQLS